MALPSPEASAMEKNKENAVDEFVKRANDAYGDRIKSITIFGSVAGGTARTDSDIDLLLVVDREDFRLRRELIRIAFDTVKVISNSDFQTRKSFYFLKTPSQRE
jgi:predicted nucleotidyltransferase